MTATSTAAPVRSAAETSRAARIGEVLFRNRGWIPVPFLAVPLLVPGEQRPITWIIGLVMVAIGELIRLAGVAAAGTVTRRRSREVQRLVDYGAFAWCRNPLYVGNWCIWLGFVVISGVLWFLPVAMLLFAVEYHYIVRYEEGVLESIFGQTYLDYKARTPRWLPRPPRAATEGPHTWGEALWSERSTVLQYVVLIAAFLLKNRYLGQH
ncbi:MAG TPA: isoprenylcysteine carboxylmethyltransferase family protein [Gemmatimonadaceae bacterium]|nr:isoprenylcysteine carboxylmethyltransferase family protein [Gemmatimonadaceae bacterium]